MTLGLLGVVIGAVVGAIGALMLVARTARGGRFLASRNNRQEPQKTVIHMRGHEPAWFGKKYCQVDTCVSIPTEDGKAWYLNHACYVDQDGHYWCEKHLPKNTKIAERAALQETEDERCVIHDYKCPKPWEPY